MTFNFSAVRITLHAVGLGPRGRSNCNCLSQLAEPLSLALGGWEVIVRPAAGAFEFLLQAGPVWQPDMGGPDVKILR